MKLVQRVRHASSKTGHGRLVYFSPKCNAIISLSDEYFPFSYVPPFCYDKSGNKGTVNFLATFGAISLLTENRRRGDESNHGILKYTVPPNFVKYSRAAREPVLKSMG